MASFESTHRSKTRKHSTPLGLLLYALWAQQVDGKVMWKVQSLHRAYQHQKLMRAVSPIQRAVPQGCNIYSSVIPRKSRNSLRGRFEQCSNWQ
jgi:hypothetical protein